MRWFGRGLLAVAVLAFMPHGIVRAEMPGDVPDKVRFSFGGMLTDIYTDAGYGSVEAGVGASVNFEDIFDLPESKEIFRAEVNWHVAKRQFIDVGYFSLNRSGHAVIDQDVEWGDYVFLTGADVGATFDSKFTYGAWRYLFLDIPQVRISGSAGVSYIDLGASLAATGSVTDLDNNVLTGSIEEEASVGAPVPLFGLQLDWALTKRLAVLMYTRQLYINNVQGIDGGITESAVRLTWWYSKHAGISGGYDREQIDLKSYESGDTKARFRYDVRGLSFYLTFAF